jgi:low affinity Fe/Cu permease
MTLFIQRSEHRDMQAMQAKLDELLKVNNDARSDLKHLDEQEPEQVEEFRAHQ